jgi:hypothetical protein
MDVAMLANGPMKVSVLEKMNNVVRQRRKVQRKEVGR